MMVNMLGRKTVNVVKLKFLLNLILNYFTQLFHKCQYINKYI